MSAWHREANGTIANTEFAWCDAQMLRASQELAANGKGARKVKNDHVQPGTMIDLVRDQQKESLAFFGARAVPLPLCVYQAEWAWQGGLKPSKLGAWGNSMAMDLRSGPNALGTVALPAIRTADFQHVKFRVESGIARLTLNRPEHNLLNERMLTEMASGINAIGEDRNVKLIVLDSAGKTFSGGIELGEYTQRRVFQLLESFHAAFTAMLDTSKPVLVVVNGPAFGGGAELAALGDLVIATPRARFAQPEIKLGVFPPLAAAILPSILGPKLALELVLTGEAITAERAVELGLVNWLVAEKDLTAKVDEIIAKVSGQSGPVLTMAKRAILGSLGLPLRDGVRNSMKVFLNELADLEDSQEGLRALVEKRAPQWKNR